MGRTKLAWRNGAQGGRVYEGNLVRWRDNKRHPWQYGIYAGAEHRALAFRSTPGDMTDTWLAYTPLYMEVAVVERIEDGA